MGGTGTGAQYCAPTSAREARVLLPVGTVRGHRHGWTADPPANQTVTEVDLRGGKSGGELGFRTTGVAQPG